MYIILEQKVNKSFDEIRRLRRENFFELFFASASYAQLLSVYL